MAEFPPQCTTFPLTADIQEQNVIFVICVLERRPSDLTILKELLIKTLFSLASKPTDCMFGVISCASQVLKWQNALVKCSLASVAAAATWIRTLKYNNGASVLHAMAAALEDSSCQAIYLFTSGLPKDAAEEIGDFQKEIRPALPLHVVYLGQNGGENKNSWQEILEKIANESGGTFQRISFSSDATEDQINPGSTASIPHPDCISKCCCCSSHPSGHRIAPWACGFISQGSEGRVLIEFERSKKSPKAKAEFRMQETSLCDVLHYEDGRWQPVSAGDRVLAPWEKKSERYGPGTALQVTETGSSHSAFKNSEVLVNFWNGKTKKVPADTVVKIPLPLSERIILELQMPLTARQMLVGQNPHCPYTVPPDYRASGFCQQNHLDCCCSSDVSKFLHVSTTCLSPSVSLWPSCYPTCDCIRSPITSAQPEDALIPGHNMTKEELNRKIEEQLSRERLPIWEGSENEENRKQKEEKNVVFLTSCKESESKVIVPNKTHPKKIASEDLREGTGTSVDVAVNTDKFTPWQEKTVFPQPSMNETSVQPFCQSPSRKLFIAPTPQAHATLVWVDQSLKEDSSTIESVLHRIRSHSVPAVRRLPATAVSPDSPGEAARTEFRRRKWEQRRLKEEQKRQEESIQKELLRDLKRHRSLQRTLQGSQKQQENSERAWQRLGRLQVAREERMRQESHLGEEEKNKESQRLEFLKTQRRHREQQLMEHSQRIDAREKKRLELLKNRMQPAQKNVKAPGQEQDNTEKKIAAKRLDFQKRDLMSQRVEKKRQESQDLQQYLREQNLLMLRASLLS